MSKRQNKKYDIKFYSYCCDWSFYSKCWGVVDNGSDWVADNGS